uniref:Uncharacterized protein n=1 Tax=Anguilla anguilla TaxID=7936 RepID=A0A0E9TXR9_ANGAN
MADHARNIGMPQIYADGNDISGHDRPPYLWTSAHNLTVL